MIDRRSAIIGLATLGAGCLGDDTDDDPNGSNRQGPQINGREFDSAFPLVLSKDGETVADVHYHPDGNSHWHKQPLELAVDEPRELEATVNDADVEPIELGDVYTLTVEPPTAADAWRLNVKIDGSDVTITATRPGEAFLRFGVHGGGDDPWVTPKLRVEATGSETDASMAAAG